MVGMCPECKALHDLDIEMRELLCTREYESTKDGVRSNGEFFRLYQCPACKSVYTETVNQNTEKWRLQYRELMESYNKEE